MSDNTNNKRIYTIWHIAAYVLSVGSVLAGMITSNVIIGLIGVGIGVVILISAKRRYGAGAFDERTLEIHRRAASTAFRLTAVGLLIFWMLNRYLHQVLGAMSGDDVSDGVGILICLMLWCYLGFYAYYVRRM